MVYHRERKKTVKNITKTLIGIEFLIVKITTDLRSSRMTEEKIIKHKHYSNNTELQTAYEWGYKDGVTETTKKLEEENNKLLDVINNQDVKIADLEKKIDQAQEIIKHLLWDLHNPGVNPAKDIEKAEHFLGRDKISKEAEDFLKEDACQI